MPKNTEASFVFVPVLNFFKGAIYPEELEVARNCFDAFSARVIEKNKVLNDVQKPRRFAGALDYCFQAHFSDFFFVFYFLPLVEMLVCAGNRADFTFNAVGNNDKGIIDRKSTRLNSSHSSISY